MTTSRPVAGLSPEVRASIFHFSVYANGSVAAVSFGIWMARKGISTDEIGIVNALPVFLMLLINVFVGRIADKASDWKSMIIVLAMISGGASIGLFFVHSFWGVLLIWTAFNLPSGSIPPLIDAATLRMTSRNGTDFGSVRAWGTVGYVICTATAGACVAVWGEAVFVPLFVFMSLARAGLAWLLPRFRAPAHEVTVAEVKAKPKAGRLREVLKPWFVLPLLGFGLIQACHAILGSFAALVWKQQGIPISPSGRCLPRRRPPRRS
jgi:PPP family 3-phenylpropionic acid transporter